jgi:restriction system protein
MSTPMWMVRAGRGGEIADRYRESGYVGIGQGGEGLGDLPYGDLSKTDLQTRLAQRFPAWKHGKLINAASQLFRFFIEVKQGDSVVTYDPTLREYFLGRVTGALDYRDGEALPYIRKVSWRAKVSRDHLSARARNPLGSTLTLFRVPDDVAIEIEANAVALDAPTSTTTDPVAPAPSVGEVLAAADDPSERAHELIDDLINELDWEELQELVAGILRAMGYKTRISPKGADRGVDIFASPDGLGLQEPRIFVEVKHRSEATSAPVIRSFLGGRKATDRCLYVSSGGFTKDGRYEAERSTIPITLVDLPALRELLLDHYERLDEAVRRLVPLARLYWPIADEE